MKRWKKILFSVAGAIVLAVVSVLVLIIIRMQPTTGPRIGTYPTPCTALLVIDIQEDYTGPHAKKRYHDGDRIVTTSNALLAQAQAKGAVVIFIQNVIDNPIVSTVMGGVNAPGAPGTEMDQRLLRVPGSRTFSKKQSDAFSNPALDTFLREKQVNRLLFVGIDAAYCLSATVHGGLNRGYHVTVYRDGIATESGKNLDALIQRWREAGAQVKTGTAM